MSSTSFAAAASSAAGDNSVVSLLSQEMRGGGGGGEMMTDDEQDDDFDPFYSGCNNIGIPINKSAHDNNTIDDHTNTTYYYDDVNYEYDGAEHEMYEEEEQQQHQQHAYNMQEEEEEDAFRRVQRISTQAALESKRKIWDSNTASIDAALSAVDQWESLYSNLKGLIGAAADSFLTLYGTAKSGAGSIEHHLLVPVRDYVLMPTFSGLEQTVSVTSSFLQSEEAHNLANGIWNVIKHVPFVGEQVLCPILMTSAQTAQRTWSIVQYPIPSRKRVTEVVDGALNSTKWMITAGGRSIYLYAKVFDATMTRTLMHTQWRVLRSGPYATLNDECKGEVMDHLCERYFSIEDPLKRYELIAHIKANNLPLYVDLVESGLLYERGRCIANKDFILWDVWLSHLPIYRRSTKPIMPWQTLSSSSSCDGETSSEELDGVQVVPLWFYLPCKDGKRPKKDVPWIPFNEMDRSNLEHKYVVWMEKHFCEPVVSDDNALYAFSDNNDAGPCCHPVYDQVLCSLHYSSNSENATTTVGDNMVENDDSSCIQKMKETTSSTTCPRTPPPLKMTTTTRAIPTTTKRNVESTCRNTLTTRTTPTRSRMFSAKGSILSNTSSVYAEVEHALCFDSCLKNHTAIQQQPAPPVGPKSSNRNVPSMETDTPSTMATTGAAKWYTPDVSRDVLVDEKRYAVTFGSSSSTESPQKEWRNVQDIPPIKMIKRPTLWRFYGEGDCVRRSTWFLDTKSGIQPYDETSSNMLEDAYQFLKWFLSSPTNPSNFQNNNARGVLLTIQVTSPTSTSDPQFVQFSSLERVVCVQRNLGGALSLRKSRVFRGACFRTEESTSSSSSNQTVTASSNSSSTTETEPSSKQQFIKNDDPAVINLLPVVQRQHLILHNIPNHPLAVRISYEMRGKKLAIIRNPRKMVTTIAVQSPLCSSNANDHEQVDHLILVVHGIGEMLRSVDASILGLGEFPALSTITDCCDYLRKNHMESINMLLLQQERGSASAATATNSNNNKLSLDNNSSSTNKKQSSSDNDNDKKDNDPSSFVLNQGGVGRGRVEYIPIEWHEAFATYTRRSTYNNTSSSSSTSSSFTTTATKSAAGSTSTRSPPKSCPRPRRRVRHQHDHFSHYPQPFAGASNTTTSSHTIPKPCVQDVSLKTIPHLRGFANDTLLDVLYFLAPQYHDTMIDIVQNEMELVVMKFTNLIGHKHFSGRISLLAHSLGSVISWDILSHQISNKNSSGGGGGGCGGADTISRSINFDEPLQSASSHTRSASYNAFVLPSSVVPDDLNDKTRPSSHTNATTRHSLNDIKVQTERNSHQMMPNPLHGSDSRDVVDTKRTTSSSSGLLVASSSTYRQLSFCIENTFMIGSPIAVFLMIRNQHQPMNQEYTLPGCSRVYNIFHPYDPAAYRLEPLIHPYLAHVEPKLINHWKGGYRVHYQTKMLWKRVMEELMNIQHRIGHTIERIIVSTGLVGDDESDHDEDDDDSSMNNNRPMDKERRKSRMHRGEVRSGRGGRTDTGSSKEQPTSSSGGSSSQIKCGQLNQGNRVDYMLQEKEIEISNEYVFALGAHSAYWDEKDLTMFIAKELKKQQQQ